MGTGGADCHDQFANWSRNDRVFTRGAVGGPMWASAPTEALQEVRGAGDRKGRPYGGACVYIIYLYNKAVFFCDVKKIFCRRGKSAAKERDFQMGSGGVRTGKVSPLWPLPVQGGRGYTGAFCYAKA
ncbi:hypothetical protein MM35RIKEN_21680 (plasmid) [Vescimonas fastidiosa]|uniref:Uncharacterized protein n=1 Tax=Vescimonas fastidiosa TaxID=2714353 RepID=A0A810Q2J0_9FIRM|nr:hypothetical protein MM35RIKEN_21680 [Vescimonas fastidiosa]